jgi:hypothetical protein
MKHDEALILHPVVPVLKSRMRFIRHPTWQILARCRSLGEAYVWNICTGQMKWAFVFMELRGLGPII